MDKLKDPKLLIVLVVIFVGVIANNFMQKNKRKNALQEGRKNIPQMANEIELNKDMGEDFLKMQAKRLEIKIERRKSEGMATDELEAKLNKINTEYLNLPGKPMPEKSTEENVAPEVKVEANEQTETEAEKKN